MFEYPYVKDTRSRRRLTCVLLFTFDLICHANILNSRLHSWWSCFYCMNLHRFPGDLVEYHFLFEVRKNWLKDLGFNAQLLGCHTAIWQNMLLLQWNVKSCTFTSTLWKSSGKLRSFSITNVLFNFTGEKSELQNAWNRGSNSDLLWQKTETEPSLRNVKEILRSESKTCPSLKPDIAL